MLELCLQFINITPSPQVWVEILILGHWLKVSICWTLVFFTVNKSLMSQMSILQLQSLLSVWTIIAIPTFPSVSTVTTDATGSTETTSRTSRTGTN